MSSGAAAAKQPEDGNGGDASAPAMSTASLSEPQYTPDGFLKIANEKAPAGALEVRGYDFNGGVDFRA
jgi:hypothetical protein